MTYQLQNNFAVREAAIKLLDNKYHGWIFCEWQITCHVIIQLLQDIKMLGIWDDQWCNYALNLGKQLLKKNPTPPPPPKKKETCQWGDLNIYVILFFLNWIESLALLPYNFCHIEAQLKVSLRSAKALTAFEMHFVVDYLHIKHIFILQSGNISSERVDAVKISDTSVAGLWPSEWFHASLCCYFSCFHVSCAKCACRNSIYFHFIEL